MDKKEIRFNKYESKDNYKNAVKSGDVDNATFSVVRTVNCNKNENNNDSGDVKDLYISNTKMTDVYNSRKQDSGDTLTTTVTVGGIPAGTKLSELTAMPLGSILDKMFFKTYTPTVKTNVSASFSYSPTDWLVGSTFNEATSSNIHLNCGEFKIENPDGTFTTLGPLSDGIESYSFSYIPSGRVVVNGTNKITATIIAKSGSAPKDSNGSSVESLKYNGGTFTLSKTLNPYYNWYATSDTVDASTSIKGLSEQSKVTSMGCKDVSDVVVHICGGDLEHPQTIKVPGTISDCEILVMGQYQTYAFSTEWTLTGTEVINNHTYNIYVFNSNHFSDGAYGGFTLKFNVNKI